jgi:hypothetical protein
MNNGRTQFVGVSRLVAPAEKVVGSLGGHAPVGALRSGLEDVQDVPRSATVAARAGGKEIVMKYTTSRLVVEGFYWVRCWAALAGREYETIMKVYFNDSFRKSDSGNGPNTVFWDGENVSIDDDRLRAFAGPIPRPEG